MRLLGFLSSLMGLLIFVKPRSGVSKVLLWVPKLLACALAPFLAIAGGFAFLLGALTRERRSTLFGLFGMLLNSRHVKMVSRPHNGFNLAFGSDWEKRIPTELHARILSNRWTLLPHELPVSHWQRDVTFDTHRQTGAPLLADLWLPPDHVPATGLGVIYLHGSGWHHGDKDIATRTFFRRLASQGHVLMDVAYTLTPRAQLHAMLADVKQAIVWMKTKGPEYGVLPDRIVLMGGSAGGHLALLAAYTPNHVDFQPEDIATDTSVRGVVSYYGPTDLLATHRQLEQLLDPSQHRPVESIIIRHLERISGYISINHKKYLPNLLGGSPEEIPDAYTQSSPIFHVGPHCPPTLQLIGNHDLGGMQPDMLRLHQALITHQIPSVYVEFPDIEHGFDLILPSLSPSAQAATYDVERFLALMLSDSQEIGLHR